MSFKLFLTPIDIHLLCTDFKYEQAEQIEYDDI